MALLFFDGFDHYATADLLKKWTSGTTGLSIASGGREGTCLQGVTGSATWVVKTLGGSATTMVMGAALKGTSTQGSTSATGFFQFREGATVHVSINTQANGYIEAWRGSGGTLLGSTNPTVVVPLSVFWSVEVKVKVDGSAGTVQVKVNGSTVLNLTGLNTKNGGTGIIDTVAVYPATCSPTGTSFVDDLYVCDTSGSAPWNDFLGDCVVETFLPNGEGQFLQLTPSTGTVHSTLVNDATPDTTTYNSSNVATKKDTYKFQKISTSTLIYGVQALDAVALDAAVATQAATTLYLRGGTAQDGASVTLNSTSQTYLRDLYQTDPSTGIAWAQGNFNLAQLGMKVVTSAANAQVSQAVFEVLRSNTGIPGDMGAEGIQRGFKAGATGRPGMVTGNAPRSFAGTTFTFERSNRGLGARGQQVGIRPVGYPIGN